MQPLCPGGAEIKIASKLSFESLKGWILGSRLGSLSQCLLRESSAHISRGRQSALLQSNAKCADQFVDELHHLRRDPSIGYCVCVCVRESST